MKRDLSGSWLTLVVMLFFLGTVLTLLRTGSSQTPVSAAPRAAAAAPAQAAVPKSAADSATPSVDQLADELGTYWDKDWGAVIGRLRKLIELDPQNPEWHAKLYAAYVNDGKVNASRQEYAIARQRFQEAIALDPDRPEARDALATIPAE